MESKNKETEAATGEKPSPSPSESAAPIEHKQLVSFGERVTYTFSYSKEIGSIHYDRTRGEIFFKGHNILHMDLEPWQMQMLEEMRNVLRSDQRTKRFAEPYGKNLDKITLEKNKAHRSSP